jgi:hypothetical protein
MRPGYLASLLVAAGLNASFRPSFSLVRDQTLATLLTVALLLVLRSFPALLASFFDVAICDASLKVWPQVSACGQSPIF